MDQSQTKCTAQRNFSSACRLKLEVCRVEYCTTSVTKTFLSAGYCIGAFNLGTGLLVWFVMILPRILRYFEAVELFKIICHLDTLCILSSEEGSHILDALVIQTITFSAGLIISALCILGIKKVRSQLKWARLNFTLKLPAQATLHQAHHGTVWTSHGFECNCHNFRPL